MLAATHLKNKTTLPKGRTCGLYAWKVAINSHGIKDQWWLLVIPAIVSSDPELNNQYLSEIGKTHFSKYKLQQTTKYSKQKIEKITTAVKESD